MIITLNYVLKVNPKMQNMQCKTLTTLNLNNYIVSNVIFVSLKKWSRKKILTERYLSPNFKDYSLSFLSNLVLV